MFVENDPTLVALLKAGAVITLPGGYRFEAVKKGDRHMAKITRPDKKLDEPILSVDEPTEFWRQVESAGLVTDRLSGETRRRMKDAILKNWTDDAMDRLVDDLIDDMPDSALIQYVEANTNFFDPDGGEDEDDDPKADDPVDIRYRCPECGHKWQEDDTTYSDSDCPNCGTRNITAYEYVDSGDTFDPDPEWNGKCERCDSPLVWRDDRPGGMGTEGRRGYVCSDQTCPFHDHRQLCPVGWTGHPSPPEDKKQGRCQCQWHGTKM